MKTEYEINLSTLAIIGVDKKCSKIIEKNQEFFVTKKSTDIIDESCKYFGSSYDGRFEGTKKLTGINYKSPIIVEETKNIIFFPLSSPRNENCIWVSLNNIDNYDTINGKSLLMFNNGQTIELEISYEILENQILRSTRLDSILRKRKNFS